MKPRPLFVIGTVVMFTIGTIVPSLQRKPKADEPSEHSEQNETQQETAQQLSIVLMDALTVNTRTGTATMLPDDKPKDYPF